MVGFKLGERRQLVGLDGQIELAQLAQLAQKIERLVGFLQEFRIRPEYDPIGALAGRTAFRRRFRHGRGVVELFGAHRDEIDPFELGRRRRAVVVLGPGGICSGGILSGSLAVQQAFQCDPAGAADRGRDRLAGARQCDQIGQDVVCRQQDVDDLRRRRQFAVAHGVEHRLEDVGEIDEAVEAENSGAALDRMDGTEHGIDGVVRARTLAKCGEALLDLTEGLAAFLEERQLQLLKACHGSCFRADAVGLQGATLLMVAMRRSGSNGFTIQPVAPASRARFFLSGSLSVVSTRIGVVLCVGLRRS